MTTTAGRADARTAAVIELLLRHGDADRVDAIVVRLLEIAAHVEGGDASLFNEIAVAHAARAMHRGALDLFRAFEWVEAAYRLDPASEVVRFNRAALLERLHLEGRAGQAWADLATQSRRSAITEEARLRTLRLASNRGDAVNADPQRRRESALDGAIAGWARASLAGDSALASTYLDSARTAGQQLAATGDSTIALAVSSIEAAIQTGDHIVYARGLAAYAEGSAAFRRAEFGEARSRLAEARRSLPITAPALRDWSSTLLGAIEVYDSDYDSADTVYAGVLRRTADGAMPSLRARTFWGIGLAAIRRGEPGLAEEPYDSAAALFEAIGERENLGAIRMLIGEVHAVLGRHESAAEALLRSSASLREDSSSPHRHSLLLVLGRFLTDLGLVNAAVSVHAEGLSGAELTERAKDRVEALARLARAETEAARPEDARAHIGQAMQLLGEVRDPVMHDWMRAELALAEASAASGTAGIAGIEALSRSVETFEKRNLPTSLVAVLALRGAELLGTGDTAAAHADLKRAIDLVDQEADRTPDAVARGMLLEAATPAFDALIGVQAERGDLEGALDILERARARATQGARVRNAGARGAALPADVVVLAYAVLPERLVTWALRRDTVAMHVQPYRQQALDSLTARFAMQVRRASRPEDIAALASELHALLLGPARTLLVGAGELVVIPDKSLHRVPFAALMDSTSGNFLIHDFAIRTVASVTAALQPVAVATGIGKVLAVGAPAHDRERFPDLEPLRAAAHEVDEVARVHDQAVVVDGAGATRAALLSALDQASVLHFAGHARFRTDAPERSYLVLAPDSSAGASDMLFAQDLPAGRWPHLRLVVLSACETLTGRATRNAGTSGLAAAFMAAGADGVVGSLWEVADRSSANLMATFHEELAAGRAPAYALRAAQMVLLRGGVVAPGSWAAFRLEGR